MFKKIIFSALALVIVAGGLPVSFAEEISDNNTCVVYITGIGCPYCANVDPVLFEEKVKENPNLVIIEYEIYQQSENAGMAVHYHGEYDSGFGIPVIIFGKDKSLSGDRPILSELDNTLKERESNPCPLLTGVYDVSDLEITQLPNSPKIWRGDRILIPKEKNGNDKLLRKLLLAENVRDALMNVNYTVVEPESVPYSGGSAEFKHAIKVGGWVLQWNDEQGPLTGRTDVDPDDDKPGAPDVETNLTLTKLISLAVVDAINPCALAVLTLMLIAILTYNPNKKRNILLAGLAFTVAVFVMYLIYGLVIIRFFQLVQAITSVKLILYKVLGGIAILLGLLNIKDVIRYRAGGFATEMPMFMRPTVSKFISKVTSPKGAFIVGLFVTVFLLPCTIGPYVIAGGILSAYDLMKTLPPLLLYNLIFVTPMLIITGIIYFGMSRVEDVSDWKDKNIRYLHLVAGIIMLLLGIAMILGWA